MSDKPIVSPTASILRDDKAILVFVGMIVEAIIVAVPTLQPYQSLLTLLAFLGFGLLVLHQSIEDLIDAWYSAKQPAPTNVISYTVTDSNGASVTQSTAVSGQPPLSADPAKPIAGEVGTSG